MMPTDKIPPLHPPRAEIPPGFWEQHGAWVVAGIVVLLALAGFAVWYWRRPRPEMATPPELEARQTLESLRGKPEDGAVLSRVSQAVRHYFNRAFALPPEETTTTEFCRLVAGREEVGTALAEDLGNFLRRCDEHKFAPPAPRPPLDAAGEGMQLVERAEAHRAALREEAARREQKSA